MKSLFLFCLIALSSVAAAQTGLQGIIIEPYYVASKEDQKAFTSGGILEDGSVTYRIYVDLEPGYRFQAAYGSPDHALEISSTHYFYNHNHSGNTHPNIIPERDLARNVTLLDSWVSAGAAAENHMGIPRKYDFLAQDGYLRFQSGYLENTVKISDEDTSPLTIQLTQCDGLARAEQIPATTIYNMDSVGWALGSVTRAKRLRVENGAWACMGKGSLGVDSLSGNHVLIAQITTAGALDYKLNIMIGTPEGKSIQYVYANPQDREVLHPALVGRYLWNADADQGRRSGKKKNKKKK
jgi:hypothetical protein